MGRLMGVGLLGCFISLVASAGEPLAKNPRLKALKPNVWLKIHEQKKSFRPVVVPASAKPVRRLLLPAFTKPPQIDGTLDDSCWQKDKTYELTAPDGKPSNPEVRTEIWMGMDDKYLYLAARCLETQMAQMAAASNKHDAGNFYQSDYVEWFLIPGLDASGTVYHLMFDNAGQTWEAKGKNLEAWNPEVTVKTARKDQAWIIEVKLPLNQFSAKELASTWRMNVSRFRPKRKAALAAESTWSLTYTSNSHAYSRFNKIYAPSVQKQFEQPEKPVKKPVAKNTVVFRRQAHGGSCFDTKRGRLILFGSNTHGKDWKNSPRIFDPITETWSVMYPDDPRSTYQVTPKGLPVAGKDGNHPWATHTFGAVMYDPFRDEMVVACYPGHMKPSRSFSNSFKGLWEKVIRFPTWTLKLDTGEWKPLPGKSVGFFPFAAAFDTDRKGVIGYQTSGIYELMGEPRLWKQTVKKGFFGWHNNCVYDSKNKALVVFGTNRNSDEIVVYYPATKEHKKMPTTGKRPPKDQHNPMTFIPDLGQTVILVDLTKKKDAVDKPTTETWCYDLGKDLWTQIESATLPFACGMNYNMEYDSNHKVLLLVTGGYHAPTVVWALKCELPEK